MSVGQYSYTELRDEIVDPIRYNNIGSVITTRNIINRTARLVSLDIDLRSMKRKAALASKLFDDRYSYAAPSDIKGDAIIDIIPQRDKQWRKKRTQLIHEEEFEQKKTTLEGDVGYHVALATDDLVNRVLFSGNVDDDSEKVAGLDSLTADGGTWVLFGDAENVAVDTDQYVTGGGSVKFDISDAGGMTAGLQNTGLNTFDITNYRDDGSVFVWVYINSITDLTNWILRIGSGTGNYLTQTITTAHESTAFVAGWNLLRFDFASMTETGTVDEDACNFIALYMTKETGKADNGYRVDDIVLHTGEYHNILYYSKYPWQSSAGTFIENSTADTDLVNADTDELELFVLKGKEVMFDELDEERKMLRAAAAYREAKKQYLKNNPTQRLNLVERSLYKPFTAGSNRNWPRTRS